MSPRAPGFDEIEAGYASALAEDDSEPREPAYVAGADEDDDAPKPGQKDAEMDEFAIAEREYLNEMRSGMSIAEEDGVAI